MVMKHTGTLETMQPQNSKLGSLLLGFFIFLGLSTLGYLLAKSAIDYKQLDRSVTVKGLSEHEYDADIVIWPIQFTLAGNDLSLVYQSIDKNVGTIKQFFVQNGIGADEITIAVPSITDKSLNQYNNSNNRPEFRFYAKQAVTVYSKNVKSVRAVMSKLAQLGKQGIVFSQDGYELSTEYIFTKLNEVKPQMIEEATRKAREVAEKFATDSKSKLGKIKRASQGRFSISERDKNNPHIKKVRVVSTVEYYLSD